MHIRYTIIGIRFCRRLFPLAAIGNEYVINATRFCDCRQTSISIQRLDSSEKFKSMFFQVSKLERTKKNLISEDTVSLQEFNEKLQELHSVRAQLERVRKDKNIISGLVNQTQRDMSSKVRTLCTCN